MGIMDLFKKKKANHSIYSGGTGDGMDNAIVINESNSMAGIRAEYVYLEKQFGQTKTDWTVECQSMRSEGGRSFDILTVKLKDGSSRIVWFDITSFLRQELVTGI